MLFSLGHLIELKRNELYQTLRRQEGNTKAYEAVKAEITRYIKEFETYKDIFNFMRNEVNELIEEESDGNEPHF